MTNVARLYRVTVEVADLDQATHFYSQLLGTAGTRIRGGRHYIDCGGIILALLDVTLGGRTPQPTPKALYFAVADLEDTHAKARELGALSSEQVHDEDAGAIVTRPWGERSFYVQDPFGNQLCFVDDQTLFTGA